MSLRAYAKPFDWNGVRLWFLPYRTLAVDIAIRQLEAIEPHFEYVNGRTGDRTTSKPDELVKAEARQQQKAALTPKAIPLKTHWQTVDKWSTLHNTFVGVLPLLVAVDWPETLSAEVATFKAFYEAKGTPAERWQLFSAVVGTQTSNALWEGFVATRDVSFAPEAAPDSAPLSETPTTES